jgi:DNA-binding NarL/FixJ family response regulator
MIKVIIADDQSLFREGLRVVLDNADDISIIGEAGNGQEVLELVISEKPDVIVTDIQMPEMDGIELTKELQEVYPEIKIIGLTMYEEDYLVVEMLEAGARGYLMKDTNRERLIEAIRVVYANGRYFCESTSMKLMKKIAGSKLRLSVVEDDSVFTGTEKQIIRHVCSELTNKEIADVMHLGIKTVESYRNKIFSKMGVKNMAGLVIYAIRCGLFRP